MEKIVLEVKNEQDAKLILNLAERLNAKVIEEKYDVEKRIHLLREMAIKNSLSESIPDPVEWQREQREDRDLPFRD